MLKNIRLVHDLAQVKEVLFLLPNGLFTINNRYIKYSDEIRNKINFKNGTSIKVKNNQLTGKLILIKWDKLFEEVKLYHSQPFNSVTVKALDLNILFAEITKMGYNLNKNPYENYLEITLIMLLMESLNNSKVLIGSIWSPGGLIFHKPKPDLTKYGPSIKNINNDYDNFIKNINNKNDLVLILRKIISSYPEKLADYVAEYKYQAFNILHSQYSTLLEFRILQIKYKIILQEICLQSYYLTNEAKMQYDAEFKRINSLLESFPVNYAKLNF